VLLEKCSESSQRRGADVVLDALGIDRRGLGVDPDGEQKSINGLVPLAAFAGQTLSLGRQLDRLVRLGVHESLTLQSVNDSIDRHMADPELSRQIGHPARFANLQDLRDRFDIVFGGFRGVIVPRAFVRL
jgi:hypothetical protein